MNLFQIQLKRLGSDGWDDMNDLSLPLKGLRVSAADPGNAKMEAEQFLTTPYSYMARVQIKYEIQTPS